MARKNSNTSPNKKLGGKVGGPPVDKAKMGPTGKKPTGPVGKEPFDFKTFIQNKKNSK